MFQYVSLIAVVLMIIVRCHGEHVSRLKGFCCSFTVHSEELEEMKRQRLEREARAKQAQEAKAQAKVVKVAEETGKVKEA